MKNVNKFLGLIALATMIYSCSSDDETVTTQPADTNTQNTQSTLESQPVALTTLNSEISIEGAAKKEGTPPAPNSNINVALKSSDVEANQKSGFNLKFSTTESNIAGAYILFKDVDNNVTSSYFDVPSSSFKTDDITSSRNLQSRKSVNRLAQASAEGETEIDVDFGEALPAGKFCGDLCLYDSENNVSQIVTFCVKVESWGGNSSIVGTWVLDDGIYNDDDYVVNCQSGQSTTVPYEISVERELTFTIGETGDFQLANYDEYKSLDYVASSTSCSAVYDEVADKDNYTENGKWSFNEDKNTLTLISFNFVDLIDPSYSEDYGNGDLILADGVVKVEGNKFTITIPADENGGEEEVVTFIKK